MIMKMFAVSAKEPFVTKKRNVWGLQRVDATDI